MSGVWLKIVGALAGVGAIVGLFLYGLSIWNAAQRVDAFDGCTKAAKSPSAALDDCDATIRPLIEATRRSAECDAALAASAKGENQLFAIRAVCSAPVKDVQAGLTAAASNITSLKSQVTTAHAETGAAVKRAEARTTIIADRKTTSDQIIAAAPRIADGRVHCDAECLRGLAGAP